MSSRLLGEIGANSSAVKKDRANLTAAASVSDYRHGFWRLQVLYPVLDCIYACLTAFLSFLLFSVAAWNAPAFRTVASGFWHSGLFGYSLLYSTFLVLALKRSSYYIPLPVSSLLDEAILVFKAIGLSMMVLLSCLYIGESRVGGIKWVLVVSILNASYLVSARSMRSSDLAKGIRAGSLVRNALIIGTGEVAQGLARHLESNPNLGYAIKGFLDDHSNHPRLLGGHADLYKIVQAHFIDEVFITTPMNRDLIKQLTLQAPEYHVSVTVVPDLYDGIGWQTPLGRIGHYPVMVLHREEVHSFQLFVKRVIDAAVATLGILSLGPMMLAIALFIKLDSPGPILYRARRVGKKGMLFDCLKFRTMQQGADKLLPQLAHLNEREGLLFKMSNDPRITAFGHFLRRYSLDELPQLLNVLKGEMSLVGPRPPELQEYLQYQLEHLRKLEVKPGITGLWQILARQESSFESYIKFDLEYIENWSVWMDLKIMLRTIPVVLSGTGM